MASTAAREGLPKPTFAKIAAMAPPTKSKPAAVLQEKNGSVTNAKVPIQSPAQDSITNPQKEHVVSNGYPKQFPDENSVPCLNKAVESLTLVEQKNMTDTESTRSHGENGVFKAEGSFEDDQTHLSNSSTKPTSFDTKSMASVTTFAMDEKESLRPDDSASVQAAEEEEFFSGPASGAAGSQVGSETGMRPFRDQFREISDRMGAPPQRVTASVPVIMPPFNEVNLQSSTDLSIRFNSDQSTPASAEAFLANLPPPGLPLTPDEKLLEALNTPKDRLLLLQLEEKIVSFVKESKDSTLDLPPGNAFGRLLAHKLADYYHLTHFVDNSLGAVRLFRTPFCRLPPPLGTIPTPSSSTNTPPPNAPAMKIMRRAGLPVKGASAGASTAASSSVPSKATSEVGAENTSDEDRSGFESPVDATPAKDKSMLTREEREAKYMEARGRIFGDFQESKSIEDGIDNLFDVSRSSSTNGKKKGGKQRTPNDDSFEARSQFNAYYPGVPFTQGEMPYNGPVGDMPYFNPNPYMISSPATPSMNYASTPSHALTSYPPQAQANHMNHYPTNMPSHYGQNNGWQNGQTLQPNPYTNFGMISQQTPMMSQHSSTRSSPAMSSYAQPVPSPYHQPNQPWVQPPYQSHYQQPVMQRSPAPVHWPNYLQQSSMMQPMPYQYGQLPSHNINLGVPNNPNQHPIPGSYNRPSFNPQTRAFVPGGGSPARHIGQSLQPTVSPPQMMRPNGNKAPWVAAPDIMSQLHHPSNGRTAHINQSSSPASTRKHDSIAKFGTPSHLPPKPPPSEVPSEFNIDTTPPLPSQAYAAVAPMPGGPLVVSGGAGLPKVNGGLTARS